MSKQTIKETIDSLRGASTVSTAWGGLMAHAANLLENTNREAKVWNHAAQAKQEELDEAEANLSLCRAMELRHKERADKLEAAIKRVNPYIQHKPDCDKGKRTDFYMISPCTCGLDKIKAELNSTEKGVNDGKI